MGQAKQESPLGGNQQPSGRMGSTGSSGATSVDVSGGSTSSSASSSSSADSFVPPRFAPLNRPPFSTIHLPADRDSLFLSRPKSPVIVWECGNIWFFPMGMLAITVIVAGLIVLNSAVRPDTNLNETTLASVNTSESEHLPSTAHLAAVRRVFRGNAREREAVRAEWLDSYKLADVQQTSTVPSRTRDRPAVVRSTTGSGNSTTNGIAKELPRSQLPARRDVAVTPRTSRLSTLRASVTSKSSTDASTLELSSKMSYTSRERAFGSEPQKLWTLNNSGTTI